MLAYALASKPCSEATNMLFFSCIGLSLAAQEIQTVVFLLKRKADRMQKMGLFNFFFGMTNACLNFQQFHSQPTQPKNSSRERRHPIFVVLDQGLNVSVEANIQPEVIESQIQDAFFLRERLSYLRQILFSYNLNEFLLSSL